MRPRTILYAGLAITFLWIFRSIISGESIWHYSFIVWNVFLAAIPLLLEPLFILVQRWSLYPKRTAEILLGATWLVFIPNSFYVLTDFMHLNAHVLVNNRGDGNHMAHFYSRGDALYVYDSMLLFVATVFSVYVGALALLHMHDVARRRFSAGVAGLSLGIVMFLISIGVFIGRYGRWNSWDGLFKPWQVTSDFIQSLGNQVTRERFAVVVITMMLLQVMSVWCVWRLNGGTAARR